MKRKDKPPKNDAVNLGAEAVRAAQAVVREAGYNAVRTFAEYGPDYAYSRSVYVFDLACDLLREIDPDNAKKFITATWNPRKRA